MIRLHDPLGQQRTKQNLLRQFFWIQLSADARHYVEACHICSTQKKANKTKRAGLKVHHAGSPMEKVHIDILGPFVESNRGHKYVLVMVDQFTKWVEIAPLPDQTAELVSKSMLEDFFCRMGCADTIFSDQGRNFESALFKELRKLLGMAKQRTTPYHPSSNGQVERLNRKILFKIRAYLEDHHKDWDIYLSYMDVALRATVNASTGFTPNMMMLGREVTLPLDLLAGATPWADPAPSVPLVNQIQNQLRDVHHFARSQLQAELLKRKRLYDRQRLEVTYDVGDAVYLLNSTTKKGRSKKLHQFTPDPS